MKPDSRDVGFELIACGLLLAGLGWLLQLADPTMDFRLLAVALVGGGFCFATGVLSFWRRLNLRWCVWLLLGLAGALGWQAWQAWQDYLAHEGGYRPVPVVVTLLCLMTMLRGWLLWLGGRGHK